MHRRSRLTSIDPARRPARRRATATATAVAVVILGGCSTTVEVTAAGGAASPACAAVSAAFPAALGALTRRPSSGTATAAWGDPAVVARCGVPALRPTAAGCVEVDGVGWVAEELSDGTRLTTFGKDPALEVLVPASHGPGPLLLPAFDASASALPDNGLHCR